jgi:enoyl-CoA hydratase/carnithine racemase
VTPVLTHVTGRLGQITLNRPRAINALTAEMVTIIARTLDDWATADQVRTVLITGSGDRGLCAGGDIRAIHADAVVGGTASLDFWAREYRLNVAVARYPKPVVAWMDGLVMGGGIGISGHASLRLVTERSRLAMPEVGIGFHPDVGGSRLLSGAPGRTGTHLALTAGAAGAADALYTGLADHYVPVDRLAALTAALSRHDAVEAVAGFAQPPPPGELAADRDWIDECYAADTVAEILDRLRDHPAAGARAAAKEIATKSPTSLVVTLRSLRSAAELPSLEAAIQQEYRLSTAMFRLPDLVEGVRAQIIDKDRNPAWQPATLAEVDPATIAGCFARTGPDLDLGPGARS